MVQAKKAGLKTMTRRLRDLDKVNEHPDEWEFVGFEHNAKEQLCAHFRKKDDHTKHYIIPSPYGKPGDILWTRETFRKYYNVDESGYTQFYQEIIEYAANNPEPILMLDGDGCVGFNKDGTERYITWKPNIHMPKEACRMWDEVVSVRIERIQDISEGDAKKEGVKLQMPSHLYKNYRHGTDPVEGFSNPVSSFESLWREINGDESWCQNPFVWVIEFKPINKPENWPL